MLQRKREALLLLAKDLEKCMKERDQVRSLIKKIVSTCECGAASLVAKDRDFPAASCDNGGSPSAYTGLSKENELELRRQKGIINELIKQKREMSEEIKHLQNKNMEAHEDIKLLRETVARQRVGSSGGNAGTSSSYSSANYHANDIGCGQARLEVLITELEASKLRNDELEQELFAHREQNKEQSNEKLFYVSRSERLNTELNHILGGDTEKAIVDIDALTLENNHLKTQLSQVKCEKDILQAHYLKLKQISGKPKPNPKRNDKSIFHSVSQRTASTVNGQCNFLSTKEVQNYLMGAPGENFPVSAKTVEELHTLALSLTETIEEKNMSLSHQKQTNKALGVRVSELENKLKAIECQTLKSNSQAIKTAISRNERPLVGCFAALGQSQECNDEDLEKDLSDWAKNSANDERPESKRSTLLDDWIDSEKDVFNNNGMEFEQNNNDAHACDDGNIMKDITEDFNEVFPELPCSLTRDPSLPKEENEVLRKFFHSIDSQLSNELKSENDLDEISLVLD